METIYDVLSKEHKLVLDMFDEAMGVMVQKKSYSG